MAAKGLDRVFHHLRRIVLLREGTGLTDEQLLENFIVNKDTASFEVLLKRHGRMVYGVCLRILGNVHDAEDAFQATFLVLSQKASTVHSRGLVGNWLYGVANTTALRVRALRAKRNQREKQVHPMPESQIPDQQWDDIQAILDHELACLPDKYRAPIVLCDLEGRSRKEVARQLKIPEGTLSSRLTTARRRLAKRLSRQGISLSAGVLATLLTQNALANSVPPTLVAATAKAVSLLATGAAASKIVSAPIIALMEGVLKTMLVAKLKTVTVALMIGVVTVSGVVGLGTQWTRAAQQSDNGKSSKGGGKSAKSAEEPAPHKLEGEPRLFESVDKPLEAERPLSLQEAIVIAVQHGMKRSWGKGIVRPEFQRQLHNVLLNVEVAYWNLHQAREQVASNEEDLGVLHKLWLTSYRAQGGNLDASVLAQIRGQHEEFRSQHTNAISAMLEAERNLRSFVGLPAEDGKRLVPVTQPMLTRVRPNWDAVLQDALNRRPELALARDNLRVHQAALTREENANNEGEGATKVENAGIRVARLELAQAYELLKNQEDKVARSLEQQYQGLNKWYRLIENRRAERRSYADALKKKFSLVEAGTKPIDLDLLDVQRRLALALTKEYQAIAEYNNALARLDFARGTIMQRHKLDIAFNLDKEPRIVQLPTSRADSSSAETKAIPDRPVTKNIVHLVAAHFEASCRRLTTIDNPDHLLLEGDVQLISKRNGQVLRIEAQRILLKVSDGTFKVESVP